MRSDGLGLLFLGLLGWIVSCAGKSDITLDGGHPQETSQQDQGGTPDRGQLDQQVGGSTCNEALNCVAGCETSSCATACIEGSTASAQNLLGELFTCLEVAKSGACQQQCTTPSSTECFACVNRQCGEERHACVFGLPYPGFGDRCDEQTTCVDELTCAGQQASGQGYCTYSCENPSEICPGAPLDTYASCINSAAGSSLFCGFVCRINSAVYKCPSPQVCSDEEAPPTGSGIYLCEVPSI